MKKQGSGIWWFVGIGLALAWAFSATTDSKKQDSTQLDTREDGFQLLNNSTAQARTPIPQPAPLPLHMQQPLQVSPAPRIEEPVRSHQPDLHLTQSQDEIEQVLPFVDLSESPSDSFVTTELPQPEMLSENLDSLDSIELAAPINSLDSLEVPQSNELSESLDDMFDDAGIDNGYSQDSMESMDIVDFSNVTQRPSMDQQAIQEIAKADALPLQPSSKMVANPFFSAEDSETGINGFANNGSAPAKITNRFAQNGAQPNMFADRPEQHAAPARELPAIAPAAVARTTVQTEYASFEDLKHDQAQWAGEPAPAQVTSRKAARQHTASDITPMIPHGEQLQLAPVTIQRCVNHIEQGKSLAKRRAAFAAREEFYSALRAIAQSHDAQTRSKTYTSALTRAVVALDEADDFFAEQAHKGIDVDVLLVIEGHESKVIPKHVAQNLSSMAAIQAYFDYARQNFYEALGQGPIASEALYSLGKLYTLSATHQLSGNPFDYAKSTVMHYAALDCDPQNYRSSNELGVLMARNGRLEKARDLFRDSLVVKQVPEAWQNLAKVHEKLAQSSSAEFAQENLKLAQLANDEFTLASQQPSNSIQRVQWVEPESYNQENTISFSENRVAELPGLEVPQKKSLIKKLFR